MVTTEQHGRSALDVSTDAAQLVAAGAFARLAADHNPDVVVLIDPQGAIRYAGGQVESLVGMTPQEVLSMPIWDFVHPSDLESAAGALNEASRSDGFHMPAEFRLRGRDDKWIEVEVTGTTISASSAPWLILAVRPKENRNEVIRRRHEIEMLVREASTVLSGVSWVDVDDVISEFGRRLAVIVGASSFSIAWMDEGLLRYGASSPTWVAETDGGSFSRLWPSDRFDDSLLHFSDDLRSLPQSVMRDRLLAQGVKAVVEIPLSGEPSWGVVRLTFRRSCLHWDDANVDIVKVLATALMSTERRCRVERALHERASTDPLTGLMNRTELYRHLDESLDTNAADAHLAVLFGDLDNFKMVNDVYGHSAGDDLLVSVAEVLRNNVRGVDVIARLGGDEFVVICPEVENLDQVADIAERITAAVDGLDTGGLPVSMSIGVAVLQDGESGNDLLQRADRHMYAMKARSSSRVVEEPSRR